MKKQMDQLIEQLKPKKKQKTLDESNIVFCSVTAFIFIVAFLMIWGYHFIKYKQKGGTSFRTIFVLLFIITLVDITVFGVVELFKDSIHEKIQSSTDIDEKIQSAATKPRKKEELHCKKDIKRQVEQEIRKTSAGTIFEFIGFDDTTSQE